MFFIPVQNGIDPWKRERINHLDIWLTFLEEFLYTALCCIVHCQGRKIRLSCIPKVLDMLKIVEAHPSPHIHFEAHEFRHPKKKWILGTCMIIRVIEFLKNFEFRNLHIMRGGLMYPNSISEEKLEIDWKMEDLQAGPFWCRLLMTPEQPAPEWASL